MPISKIRGQVEDRGGELDVPPDEDLRAWLVLTQLAPSKPHVSAGWIDARDARMAMEFARHHYGRDQKVVSIWSIPRAALVDSAEEARARRDEPAGDWLVITQANDAPVLECEHRLESLAPEDAWQAAEAYASSLDDLHGFRIVRDDDVVRTSEDDLIWPVSDQSYRLARGYSKSVREKWDQLRSERDLDEYRQEDLKETF